ncbi:hypothetical protein B0H14DRAFT_3428505 [Mycena olivaceomarginata]|nr:hypothetical protein B0H14DRAFT_3428505 [Mycena olivaceomarginata]
MDEELHEDADAVIEVNPVPERPASTADDEPASTLRAAWDVVLNFATTSLTYPEAEKGLNAVLEDPVVAETAVRGDDADFTKNLDRPLAHNRCLGAVLPPVHSSDRRLKEAEKAFSDVLSTLRKERYIRGEEAPLDELFNPLIEQEDLDSEFLRFC